MSYNYYIILEKELNMKVKMISARNSPEAASKKFRAVSSKASPFTSGKYRNVNTTLNSTVAANIADANSGKDFLSK
jgi:hypothetical protein